MADQLKEIYAGTIQWGGYSGGAQTLFTTDANTRYVIKDVAIGSSSYSTAPLLKVNGFKIASLGGNSTGSEIIDVSSSVTINADTSGAYINVLGHNNTTGQIYPALSDIEFAGSAFGGNANSLGSPTSLSTALTSASSARTCWLIGGNFYYYVFDGNSTTSFYKRTGGVNGTETTLMNIGYVPVTFDGVSKFYWINTSGQLYEHNTTTGATNYITGSFNGGTTYPFIGYCNGFIFFNHTYSNVGITWYHVATGARGEVTGVNYSSKSGWAIFYDADTFQYRIVFGDPTGFATSYYYVDMQGNAANTSISSMGSGTLTSTVMFRLSNQSALGGKTAIMLGSTSDLSKIYLVDKTMTILSSKSIANADFNATRSTQYMIASPTLAQKNAVGPQISLRITGVKST